MLEEHVFQTLFSNPKSLSLFSESLFLSLWHPLLETHL